MKKEKREMVSNLREREKEREMSWKKKKKTGAMGKRTKKYIY